jgi:cupin fold WbuC family metalloprotein
MAELLDRWIPQGAEVLYPRPGVVAVTPEDIVALKRRAAAGPRGRCRICLHANADESLHDMVIVLARGTYDRPHRHLAKAETMIALEGEALYFRFAVDGKPTGRERFSAGSNSNGACLLRTVPGEYHGLLIESEWLVFCESTLGPFDPAASEFAPWSPVPEDKAGVEHFLGQLRGWRLHFDGGNSNSGSAS